MDIVFEEIIHFIRKLYNKPEGFIPLHEPHFSGNEKKYLEQCIDSTYVSSVGKYVDEFEIKMAEYTGSQNAVVCVNGTSALHIALLLAEVTPETEVITQPLTFIATANAISYSGAKPVFVDVDKDTLGLSADKLEHFFKHNIKVKRLNKSRLQIINKTTSNPITAVLPMHTFGYPCRIDEIVEICDKYNIPVIEDAAESVGSKYKDRHAGTFGKIGVLSFNGNKIITTGGGGMILTNNEEIAKKAKHITTQAKMAHPWEFIYDEIGYNYRMPNINAALGLAQLEQLPVFTENKRKTAQAYKGFFKKIGIEFVNEPRNSVSNYWLNAILLKDKTKRDSFLKYTNENGIMTRPTWTLMNKLKMFKNCPTGDLTNAKWLEERIVNIPSSVII
ncbi:GDP-perosamine synthase [subsurface metagenome]